MQEALSLTREYPIDALMCHKGDMADDANLYLLLKSIQPEGLTENGWISRAQVSRNFFQAVKKGSRPRSDTLEKVIIAAGLTPAQFYDLEGGRKAKPVDDGSPKRGLPFQRRDEPLDIPLLGTAQGSDMEVESDGEIAFVERMDLDLANTIEYIRRPSSLANRREVYAITVIGNSMADRFEDGDPAYVDPARQARNGDYVVVQLKQSDEQGEERLHIALLKKLVRKTSTYVELYQKNPECTFTIPLGQVHAIHRVIPWREVVFF